MSPTTHQAALSGLRNELQATVEELARDGGAPGSPRVELERPRDEKHGDYATNAAMLLAPVLRTSPRAVAERIAEAARGMQGVASVDVAGPGFINLTLTDEWYLETLRAVLDAGSAYGSGVLAQAEPVLLEFVSANPTGPMVAASARHAAYGDALARVLRHAGHQVATEYYVNDAGGQIDKFGLSILARATGGDVPEGGYEGEYVGELATELGASAGDDPAELGTRGVAAMMDAMRASLARLDVTFDRFQSEGALHASGAVSAGVDAVRAAGHTFEEDGAVMLRTTAWDDDRDRAIVRGNGVPTYFAADIAYMVDKFSRVGDGGRLVYVLGADHHGFIARLKAVAQALGHDADLVEIVIMQMVNLVEGGEQKKMSKRRGEFVTSDELVERIGADATRFFMLQRSHDQALDIDLALAEQHSDANPVYYVQYAHARLCSIRRRLVDEGVLAEADTATAADALADASLGIEALHTSERRLVKRIAEFPMLVAEAAERRQPHRVVHYVHDLASDVSRFYRDCRVTGDGIDPAITQRRAATCDAARTVIALALELVGVSAPERM